MRMIRMTVHRSLARAQNDRTTTRITHKPILADPGADSWDEGKSKRATIVLRPF